MTNLLYIYLFTGDGTPIGPFYYLPMCLPCSLLTTSLHDTCTFDLVVDFREQRKKQKILTFCSCKYVTLTCRSPLCFVYVLPFCHDPCRRDLSPVPSPDLGTPPCRHTDRHPLLETDHRNCGNASESDL